MGLSSKTPKDVVQIDCAVSARMGVHNTSQQTHEEHDSARIVPMHGNKNYVWFAGIDIQESSDGGGTDAVNGNKKDVQTRRNTHENKQWKNADDERNNV